MMNSEGNVFFLGRTLPGKPFKVINVLGIGLALILYLVIAGHSIAYPGLQYDEAFHVPAAINLIQDPNFEGEPQWEMTIAGRKLPLLHLTYLGSLRSYLFALMFWIFGISVETFRFTNIALTLGGLLFFLFFVKEALGWKVALCTALVLATDPTLILLSRCDWGPISLGLLLRCAALFRLYRWWVSGGKPAPAFAAAFLMGLGFYDKTNFFWFVVAMAVGGVALWLAVENRPLIPKRNTILAMGFFLLGSLPFWVYNLFHKGASFQFVLRQRPVEPIFTRWLGLKETFEGRAVEFWFFNHSSDSFFSGSLFWPFFWIALAVFVWIAIMDGRRRPYIIAFLLLIGAMAAQIFLTPMLIGPHHWFFLFPFPHLLIALFFIEVQTKGRHWFKWGVVQKGLWIVPFTVFLAFNGMTIYSHQKLIETTGGRKSWSSCIYPLAETLKKEYAHRPIQIMDWGMANQLYLLSAGSLKLNEPYWPYRKRSGVPPEYVRLVSDPDNVFIFHAPSATVCPEVEIAFHGAVQQARVQIKKEKGVFEKDGKPIYRIIELSAAGNGLGR